MVEVHQHQPPPPPPPADEEETQEPLNWVRHQESKSEDVTLDEKEFQEQEQQQEAPPPHEEDSASQLLADLFESHIHLLMRQLLGWHGLSQSWADVLAPLVQSLAHTIRPDGKIPKSQTPILLVFII